MSAIAIPESLAGPVAPAEASSRPGAGGRSVALDAYRGLIMILLVSHGFGFSGFKGHPVWGAIAAQLDHVAWEGMVLWDLIQPAFMFMVGVAMPFSFARRAAAEQGGFASNFLHVLRRCLILVFLSQLFTAVHSARFEFGLINVLSQIAFTYLICFLLMQVDFRSQVAAAFGLLAAHTLLFLRYPGPDGPFSQTGNVGQVIDQWLLGRNYSGLYVTINFVSSAVTTLFGVWAGMLLRSDRPQRDKLRILLWSAAGCVVTGVLLSQWVPMVKRIWTASFTLYSAGYVIAGLAAFVYLVDYRGWRRFAFPMVVVGMNSIFAYCISQLCRGGIHRATGVFTGKFEWIGTLAPVFHACATLGVIWYMCYWLYQRKAFVKV
jgi:predicted acyltransferase